MDVAVSKLTVFFEEPFWIGVYERQFKGKLEVCKIIFGAEPKDYDVYEFLLKTGVICDLALPSKQRCHLMSISIQNACNGK